MKKLYANSNSASARLFKKWENRIPDGWYGFDGIKTEWLRDVDDFLIWLEKKCPHFEIHQIKEKFNSLRVYIQTNTKDAMLNEEIQERIDTLEYQYT